MNPAVAGLTAGMAISLLGLAVIWPALGKGPLAVLGRVSAVFLGKLALVVTLVLIVHARAGSDAATRFAITLAATVVTLLLAQGGLLAWRIGRLEAAKTQADRAAATADAKGED